MRPSVARGGALLALAAVVGACACRRERAEAPLAPLRKRVQGLDLGPLGDLPIRDVSRPAYAEHVEEQLTAGRDDGFVRLRVVSDIEPEQAMRRREHEFRVLQGLHETRLPPYPEFIEQGEGCDDRFRPVLGELPDGRFAVTFADANLGYGVCTEDLARHRALYAVIYCSRSRRHFRVEYFTDPGADPRSLESLARSFRCD